MPIGKIYAILSSTGRWTMVERRKYVRIPESSHISYKCIPKEKVSDYITRDVSQGGIRFLVHDFIPKGSYLKIKLDLSGGSISVEAMARLVWVKSVPHSDEYEVGVEFIDMPQHAAAHLMGYIKDFFRPKERVN